MPAVLCSLLQFPPTLQVQGSPPQEFALQFWNQQKTSNASLVIGIMGMLIGSKGSSVSRQPCPYFYLMAHTLQSQGTQVFVRCLIELALASNAPTPLKTQVRT